MVAVARSQALSAAAPALVALIRDGQRLLDPYSLKFQVYDVSSDAKRLAPVRTAPPVPTPPTPDPVYVDVDLVNDRLGLGRYAAKWTVPVAEPLGRHLIKWYLKRTTASTEESWTEEFEVLAGLAVGVPQSYCLLCDLREQGIAEATYSDVKLLVLASEASRFVERCTCRFFEPRYQSLALSGTGGQALFVEHPIIAVETVSIASQWSDDYDLDDADFVVYNRHLDGLLLPDDREVPKIDLVFAPSDSRDQSALGRREGWPTGKQNVVVTGVFGYTDPDGSPVGCTPREIRRVVMALVYRDLLPLTSADREDRRLRHLVTSETVRDQTIARKFAGDAAGGCTAFTGDSEIDSIILRYRRGGIVCAA